MHDIMAINVALITGKVIFDKTPYVLYRQHGNNVLGYSHKKIQIGKWIKEKLELIRNKEDQGYSGNSSRRPYKAVGNWSGCACSEGRN